MKLLEYYFSDVAETGWEFDRVHFKDINLLVGNTATGKTRFLNTIFNLGRFAASNDYKNGHWDTTFEHSGIKYRWNLQTEKGDDDSGAIVKDYLWKQEDDRWVPLIKRDKGEFLFQDNSLPKLSPKETSVFLLQEEEVIQPLHQAFGLIKRRLFHHDALSRASQMAGVAPSLIEDMKKGKDLLKAFHADLSLNVYLYIMSEYFKGTYRELTRLFRETFPFVEEVRITELSHLHPSLGVAANVPVFTVRERDSSKWVPLNDLSSGMQKVLLILTDLLILPEGGIYVIDEYENSLGVNAINFFPEFIQNLEKDIQIFVTSHHPYLINEIPPRNWYVFHREGMHVQIRYGEEVEELFGKSRQQAFIQLINDPLFLSGVR